MKNDDVRSESLPVPVNGATLEQLADRANQAHEKAVSTAHNAVEHALVAGQALLEARRLCAYGRWYAWLADHFRGSKRTAQAYMRLAVHIPQIEGDAHGRAHLRHEQLRCMLTGMAATDGRVRATRAPAKRKDEGPNEAKPVAESQPRVAREGGYMASAPYVRAYPGFERVARSLRQVLVDLDWLTISNTISDREYAEHLLGRLRAVYDGLASLRWFHDWHVRPDFGVRMQLERR